jgi:hypothetical protein
LPEDLGLAQNERVEPRGDPAQMAGDVLARVHVEVVEQQLARDAVRARERVHELVAGILDLGREPRVELHAVTGLQYRVLEHRGAALGAGAERADALAQLDGSGAVAEPEADETVHSATILLRSIVESSVVAPAAAKPPRFRDRRV